MHYRQLTIEELEPLEKEFVDFLVVNGITAPDWEQMKEEEPERAVKIIGLFSAVVFEGIFRKVKFLEIKTSAFIHTYQCLADKIILVGIESTHSDVNLLKQDFQNEIQNNMAHINFLVSEKKYSKKREHELFEMTQKGCDISDGDLFKKFSLAYAKNQNG